jgi:hypothetical protein
MKIQDGVQLKSKLAGFIGTEKYYPCKLPPMLYTDGIAALIDYTECGWLIDDISLFSQMYPLPFQIWTLQVNANKSAILKMKEGSREPIRIKRHYNYMDFPTGTFELWYENGVLILPSEHKKKQKI